MIADLEVVITPQKRKEDGPMPTNKIALWTNDRLWMHRLLFYGVDEELPGSGKEDLEVNNNLEVNDISQTEIFDYFSKCARISNHIICMIQCIHKTWFFDVLVCLI